MYNIAEYSKLLEEARKEEKAFRNAPPKSPLELFRKGWKTYLKDNWFRAEVIAAEILQSHGCYPCGYRITIKLHEANISLTFNVRHPELSAGDGYPNRIIWWGDCEFSHWFDIMKTSCRDVCDCKNNYSQEQIDGWIGKELEVLLTIFMRDEIMTIAWRSPDHSTSSDNNAGNYYVVMPR